MMGKTIERDRMCGNSILYYFIVVVVVGEIKY